MIENSFDHQIAIALTAFAAAICKQPSIDGQRLRIDFLDALEGLAQSPEGVETVGRQISSVMNSILILRTAEDGKPQ